MSGRTPGSRALVAGVALAAAALAAGFAAGWHARGRAPDPDASPMRMVREQGASPWKFINPLLECDEALDTVSRPELVSFKQQLTILVEDRRLSGEIAEASLYFRELNDGPWIGIHERKDFIPASLLKLPTLISVLKRAESDPGLLQRRLTFAGVRDDNAMIAFRPPETLEPGKPYSVEELCRRMVQHSDNNATGVLNRLIPPVEQNETLRGLGVLPELVAARGRLNIKTISAFMRVLYNASYLDRERSELALEMLSHSSFRDGIISGLPAGVRVCSKYGEAEAGPGVRQLHEIAIVYHPSRPYLLGIMTQGGDLSSMARFVGDVSRVVYAEVDRQSALARP